HHSAPRRKPEKPLGQPFRLALSRACPGSHSLYYIDRDRLLRTSYRSIACRTHHITAQAGLTGARTQRIRRTSSEVLDGTPSVAAKQNTTTPPRHGSGGRQGVVPPGPIHHRHKRRGVQPLPQPPRSTPFRSQ